MKRGDWLMARLVPLVLVGFQFLQVSSRSSLGKNILIKIVVFL
jgi:hypothetical protein